MTIQKISPVDILTVKNLLEKLYLELGEEKESIAFLNGHLIEKLIQKVIAIALTKNWKRIDVTAPTNENTSTINFYKRNGFTFTGPKLKYSLT